MGGLEALAREKRQTMSRHWGKRSKVKGESGIKRYPTVFRAVELWCAKEEGPAARGGGKGGIRAWGSWALARSKVRLPAGPEGAQRQTGAQRQWPYRLFP